MPRMNDCWGIEVGANAIKALRLVGKTDTLTVADFAVIPFKKLLTTPDLDADEQIQVGLDQFLSAHADALKSTIVVSVPGHAAFARFAKLPPVEPKKIPDIVKFEAVQQIPFPVEQVEWDYQIFATPDSPDVEVGIFAMTGPKVQSYLDNYREVGITPDGMTLSPVAVYNAITFDNELNSESNGVVMLDVGTTSTDVIIHEAGKLWMRTLSIGGNDFTEALVRAFKLSLPKAEKLKREAGTSKYARQIFTAMRPVFSDFVQEVQRSLGYYQSLNRDAKLDRLVGLGSTFRLPGLQKYLKQQLKIEVVRPDSFNRLNIDGKRASEFAEHTINFATAYGLALQGLGRESVTANILPVPQIRQRVWRAKQPWFAAAAAVMILPVILMWANVLMMSSTQGSAADQTEASKAKANSRLRQLKRGLSEATSGDNKIDQTMQLEELQRLLDYRDVWPKVMADMNAAAAALEPQADLLASDFAKIKQIPRPQRRRIHIESIEIVYEVQAGGAMTTEALFAPPQPQATSSSVTSEPRYERRGLGGPPQLQQIPPTFHITIKGTTPKSNAPQFIGEHFINWLRENSDRPDRPYRVVLSEKPITRIEPVKERRRDDHLSQPARQGAGRPLRRANERFSGNRGKPAAPSPSAKTISSSIADVAPVNPLANEPVSGDSEFEIALSVQIVAPSRARLAEAGERTQPKPAVNTNPASQEARQ